MSLRNTPSFARTCPLRAVVAAALFAAASTALAAPPETVRVIVAYKAGGSASAKAAVAAARGQVKLEIPGMDAMAVEVPAAALAGLQANTKFAYVEEDVKRYPMARRSLAPAATGSAGQVAPYGIAMVQANQVAAGATARKICIIDSGYDLGHEDLPSVGVSGKDDPAGAGSWSIDENHHGTHVAGTIAALNNAVGVVGVTTDSQKIGLHIIKVFDANGWAYSSSLVAAATECQKAGANVISMSLGGSLSSRTEQTAFSNLLKANILSIAAAGNDGNKRNSYPASYSSVVSVAAVDVQKKWATFSQYNSQVELAAPGVNVQSTVPMGAGRESALTVGGFPYAPGGMDGSPVDTVTAPLADFGLGGSVVSGSMTGKVCLIQRGTYEFGVKVKNCQDSGGVGAVIYNNVAGGFGGTTGTTATAIPSVTASDTEGAAMKGQLGQSATVAVTASNYAFYDGTSMATPHVSAVAALVWSHFPGCSAASLRTVLQRTAEDLAPAGRDTKTGFGIVRAKNAYDFINAKPTTCGL